MYSLQRSPYILYYILLRCFSASSTRHFVTEIMVFIKGILIIAFVQDPYLMFNFLYRGFLLFMDGVSVQLACSIDKGSTCNSSEIAILKMEGGGVFSNIDLMFNATLGVESNVAYIAAFVIVVIILIFTGVGLPLAITLIASYFAIIKTFLWLLMSYITAFIAIIFLLMFTPIFFTCFLFSATRPLFTQWMANLISYCFQPILIVTFIFMMGESARIGALFEQVNVLARAAGALPICDRNPLPVDQYHIEDQYGLFDIDGRFHAMKIFYPWMDDPPFCQNGGLRPCPYFIENYVDAGSACNSGSSDPCFTYGKDESMSNRIKFDGTGNGVLAATALAQIDGDPTTGVIGAGNRVAKRAPAPAVTGGWDGLERVECGVFIMPNPIADYWDFSMPIPKFRNPRRRYPVPAHFFGYNQPEPLPANYVAGTGNTASDPNNGLYYYTVSFIVAFKVLAALIIVWYIVSSTMEAFLAKVPEFSRRLIQFESQMGSAVITGQSPTFAEVTQNSDGPGASGDVKGNYQFRG